jgi:hypothetical protein
MMHMPKKTTKKSAGVMSDLISQAEAARLRGVTRAAIADLIKRRKLRSVEVAGRALVYRSEIINYEQGEPGRPRKTGT